jgi:hypothetical protein
VLRFVFFFVVVVEGCCWFLFGGWVLVDVMHSFGGVAHPMEAWSSLSKLLCYSALETNFLFSNL